MADIFISYKTEDRPRAEQFVKALRAEKLDVWWDQDILPGQNLVEEIAKNLKIARCIVVLWSQACARSKWVEDETLNGLSGHILVPVWLEDAPLPWIYGRVLAASLKHWTGDPADAEFQRLVRGVALKLSEGRQKGKFWMHAWRVYVSARRSLVASNLKLNGIAAKIRGNGGRGPRVAITILGTLAVMWIMGAAGEWCHDKVLGPAYVDQNLSASQLKQHEEARRRAEKISYADNCLLLAIFGVGAILTFKVWKLPRA